MEVLDTNTLIPLGLIILVAGSFIGAVVWLTNLHSLSKNTAEKTEKLEKDTKDKFEAVQRELDAMKDLHTKNSERLIRMEGKLDDLPEIKKALGDVLSKLAERK